MALERASELPEDPAIIGSPHTGNDSRASDDEL